MHIRVGGGPAAPLPGPVVSLPSFSFKPQLYENHFVIYNPGNYVAKLKVQGFFRKDWSEWSAPQLFGEWGALPPRPPVC